MTLARLPTTNRLRPATFRVRVLARLGQHWSHDPEFERLDRGRTGLVFIAKDDVVFVVAGA